jgi:hypothetical protein
MKKKKTMSPAPAADVVVVLYRFLPLLLPTTLKVINSQLVLFSDSRCALCVKLIVNILYKIIRQQ